MKLRWFSVEIVLAEAAKYYVDVALKQFLVAVDALFFLEFTALPRCELVETVTIDASILAFVVGVIESEVSWILFIDTVTVAIPFYYVNLL